MNFGTECKEGGECQGWKLVEREVPKDQKWSMGDEKIGYGKGVSIKHYFLQNKILRNIILVTGSLLKSISVSFGD